MPKRKLILTSLLLPVVTFLAYIIVTSLNSKQIPLELLPVLKPQPKQLNSFSLIDHHHKAFTLDHLKNKNTLIFFGYTSCPDICPTTLSTLDQIVSQLKSKNENFNFNVIFVSVDPDRDSTEKLAAYMNYFNKEFIAVTGPKNEIDKFSKQFGAGYFIEDKNSDGNYLVSHTSSIFLIKPDLDLVASFSPPHDPDIIVKQLMLINEGS